MAKFIMLIGLPASGKSNYAEKFKSFDVHSSDKIREEFYGDASYQGNPMYVFTEMEKRTLESLKNNRSVIYDATNLSLKNRKNLLSKLPKDVEKQAVVFVTPYEECLKRNKNRERVVPKYVLLKMLLSFEVPTKYEGFDKIKFIRNGNRVILDDKKLNINQNNPWHSLSLLEHMKSCASYVREKEPDNKILYLAAKMHDIGKIYALTTTTPIGSEPPRNHYYCHENASAYIALCILLNDYRTGKVIEDEKLTQELLDITLLINMHMRPLNAWVSEKTKNKDFKRLGSEYMIHSLELLHKADKQAYGKRVPLYTPNSYICSFIYEYPNDWEQRLNDIGVSVKRDGDLALFKYNMGCNFTDPVVAEARGIIINIKTLRVVCWAFDKFGNYGEYYVKDINWDKAKVQEKLDGSIVKLWFNEITNSWQWSTNGVINAKDAEAVSSINIVSKNYQDIINKALLNTYPNINDLFDKLDKENTYIFELTSPENTVVIHYKKYKLWHIGTRNNRTGKESICDIGFDHPKEYPLKDLESCIELLKTQNKDSIEHEGFVVVDNKFNRIKLKTEEYLMMHNAVNNHSINLQDIIDIINSKDIELYNNIIKQFPDMERIIKYYEWQYAEFKYKANYFAEKALILYDEYSNDRKAVAQYLLNEDSKYAKFGFFALDNKDINEEIQNMTAKDLKKYITEYYGIWKSEE